MPVKNFRVDGAHSVALSLSAARGGVPPLLAERTVRDGSADALHAEAGPTAPDLAFGIDPAVIPGRSHAHVPSRRVTYDPTDSA
jgi:hypothetical protein